MLAKHVFFIRGLSTYGSDNAQWSVFDFGPMYKHLGAALEARGITFHPVLGLGAGSLPEIAKRAQAFLTSHSVWNDPNQKVHLIGHSAGGLALRLVLPQLKRPVASALTVATPNHGSELAEICVSLPERYKGSHLLLKTCGYNVAAKQHFFTELTRENVGRILGAESQVPAGTRVGSVVCSAPRAEWCWPLKMFYKVKAFDDFRTPSDGLVERDSQPFGDVVAEVNIDHFRQVGLFGGCERFSRLCDAIAGFIK